MQFNPLIWIDLCNLYVYYHFHNTSIIVEASIATSLTIFGAWIGCLACSNPSQKYGKRLTLLVNNSFFIVGAALSSTGNIYTLFIGRFISGIGVGVASGVPSVLLSEIASTETRGTITTLHQVYAHTLATYLLE